MCISEVQVNNEKYLTRGIEKVIKEEVGKILVLFNQNTKQQVSEQNVNMVGDVTDSFIAYDCHFAFGVVEKVSMTQWILDSGASIHICCNVSLMKSVKKLDEMQKIYLPDGSMQEIEYAGVVQITPQLILHRVLLAPGFTHNLVSVAQLAKELSVRCTFLDTHCLIQKKIGDSVLGIAKVLGRLYVVESANIAHANNVVQKDKLGGVQWHEMLGHVSVTAMKHMAEFKDLCDKETVAKIASCEICHQAKQCRSPFPLLQHNHMSCLVLYMWMFGALIVENV